jgi:cytochrome c553
VADRTRIPYYLLLVGSPEAIPFEFQYGLAMHHAVGRLDFDVPGGYATYARSIVMCENGDFTLPRRLLVFAPRHEADRATGISERIVAQPMIERFRQSHPTWTCLGLVGQTATKDRLADAFGGQSAALAICAFCHGMQFRREDALQESRGGALVCQDWSGHLRPDHYYSADDVPDTARLAGTMACLVATNSAGTPTHDEFSAPAPDQTRRLIADRPFVSALAKRLLSHPNGSALAVIGHVDRNWIHSLVQPDLTASTGLFESVMSAVLNGHTIGSAMAAIAQRTTFLYAALGEWYRKNPSGQETAVLRNRITAAIDARNFILLGDPAARLPLTGGQEVPASPMLPAATSEEAGVKGVGAETPAAEPVIVEDVVFAGVNGDSGLPAMPSMATAELAAVVAGVGLDRARQDLLRQWYARSTF